MYKIVLDMGLTCFEQYLLPFYSPWKENSKRFRKWTERSFNFVQLPLSVTAFLWKQSFETSYWKTAQ